MHWLVWVTLGVFLGFGIAWLWDQFLLVQSLAHLEIVVDEEDIGE